MSTEAGTRFDQTYEPHVKLVAKHMLRCVIERVTGGKDARQPPHIQRVRDQLLSERRCIAASMAGPRQHPSKLDVVPMQISTRAEAGEADCFPAGFQGHRSVAQVVVRGEVTFDEPLGFRSLEGALIERELHQMGVAKKRDERLAVTSLVRPQQDVPGIKDQMAFPTL